MVNMGVGDKKEINFIGFINVDVQVSFFNFRVPLMHAAIDCKTMTLGLENIFNRDYRIHGSGVNEPGRNLVFTAEVEL